MIALARRAQHGQVHAASRRDTLGGMRFSRTILAVTFGLTFLAALAYTQTPANSKGAPANFSLTGDRFKPLTWEAMTPAQKTMVEHILAGDRKNLGGPFNVLLRSPEMGDLAQAFGAQARFHSSLPPKLNELAIIVTARFWMVQFEWNAHRRAAAQAGVSEDTIQAIATGKRPAKLAADETVVYNFATEVLKTHAVSDATFAAAKNALGERGVVDMMAVMGYYQIVAMMLNVDRYPMPEGVAPELKPLAQPLP
jgi:4-carboxymuconolactone decarboxylase